MNNYSKSYFKLDNKMAPFKVQRISVQSIDSKAEESKNMSRSGILTILNLIFL